MITEGRKRYLECIDIMASGETKASLALSTQGSPRPDRRPTWRTQHLTNALFRAFKRTTAHRQGRERVLADEA